jgi:hypothetical protein
MLGKRKRSGESERVVSCHTVLSQTKDYAA